MSANPLFPVIARLCDELPAITAGDAGCLMPDWLDPDAMALLALLDPRAGAPWEWRRDGADAAYITLTRPVLGVEVAAGDPSTLADALEHLAACADAAVPAAQGFADAHAPDDDGTTLRAALSVLLRRRLALPAAAVPWGSRFRAAGTTVPGGEAGPRRHPDQDAFHAPEVQDHRAVIPPTGRSSA